MNPAEAAIREALAALGATAPPENRSTSDHRQDWAGAIRSLLSELDALRLELENSKATEASLRTRCEAAEALLREVCGSLKFHQEQTRPIHDTTIVIGRIDAHLKGACQ